MANQMIIELNKKLDALRTENRNLQTEMEKKFTENPGSYSPSEYNEKLARITADAEPLMQQLKSLKELEALGNVTVPQGEPPAAEPGKETRGSGQKIEFKSWGERFTDSMEFKQAVELGLEKTRPMNVKAQYSGSGSDPAGTTGTYGGHMVVVDRITQPIDIAPLRPRRVLDMVGKSTTSSDRVEYPRITTKTNNADVVPERNAANTDFATKPQSEMQFDLQEVLVRTIAHWIPASRQILMDAPQLRSLIDNFLPEGLELKVEDMVVNGTGTGNQWEGLLSAAGLSRVHATSGRGFNAADNIVDTIRRAITDINLQFFRADGILMHPTQAETLELLKDDNKQYLNVFNPLAQTVWRLPVVESQVIAAGTAIVGNFRQGCTLWDRMQTDLRVGEPNDFFIKNAVAVLAELRAAFAVLYENMFEKVTGLT